MFTPDQTVIIAGNGPSLAHIPPGHIGADDVVLRTNNFFLEEQYYLGPRVDLVLISGDPRVAPFMIETLRRCEDVYQIKAWTADSEKIIKSARSRLRLPFIPMPTLHGPFATEIQQLSATYNGTPTSGVRLLLMAYLLGARKLNLVGIDLYSGPQRYAFQPGPRMRRVLGKDLGSRSWDKRLHHPDIDLRLINLVARDPEVELYSLSPASPLSESMPLAPPASVPEGPWPEKPVLEDWAGWAGWYPLPLLEILRKGRRWQRRLLGK